MTTNEFKALYGRTYTSVMKEIEELEKQKRNNYTVETYMGEKYACHGHGIFVGTGEFIEKTRRIDGDNTDIQKKIDELYALVKPILDEKNKIAKIKRYQKEIAELEKELAYKKEWLKNNMN